MYGCTPDQTGKVLLHRNLRKDPDFFLRTIAPFRDNLVVAVECIFTWYWLADLCAHEGIDFVLGHALYMKAIHGGKATNDKVDALEIATLLWGGMLPHAYVYPPEMRSTRDLLRRRSLVVRHVALNRVTARSDLLVVCRQKVLQLPAHFAQLLDLVVSDELDLRRRLAVELFFVRPAMEGRDPTNRAVQLSNLLFFRSARVPLHSFDAFDGSLHPSTANSSPPIRPSSSQISTTSRDGAPISSALLDTKWEIVVK